MNSHSPKNKLTLIFLFTLLGLCNFLYAAPQVTLTSNYTAIDDDATRMIYLTCDDSSTPNVANFYCRGAANSTANPGTGVTLSWTSQNATECTFLPTTDSFGGTRPIYEATNAQYFPSENPHYTPGEVLPTSGSRYYKFRGGATSPATIFYAYNNITAYTRTITMECSDASGNKSQASINLNVTGNQKPIVYSFAVSGVTTGGHPGVYAGQRLTPYTTQLFVQPQTNVYPLTPSAAGIASIVSGVDSVGWMLDTTDTSLDVSKVVAKVTELTSGGTYTQAAASSYVTTPSGYVAPANTFNQPDTFTFIQQTPDVKFNQGYSYQYSVQATTGFTKIGTFKLGAYVYDSSISQESQASTNNLHITVSTVCPPGYIQSGTACTETTTTVAIFEHGTNSGPNQGTSQQYDVGNGTPILTYANKRSTTPSGPTVTIDLGQNALTSAYFASNDFIDSLQMYFVGPQGSTNWPGSLSGVTSWNYAYPTGSPSGWWKYKTTTPDSQPLSSNVSYGYTRTPHLDQSGFTTQSMSFRTTESGEIVQDRPEVGATNSSQTTGVKNVSFTPTQPGLYKICASAYSRYDALGSRGTTSCYNLQVNCPAGQTQQGTLCVASGPPSFTLSAYIQGKPSDPNTPITSGAIEANTNDGSYHEWRYIISGTPPASCSMQRRSDGGVWSPAVGYATDINGYTAVWANLPSYTRTLFMLSFNNTHEWKLTCTDSLNRTGSLIWKLNKVSNPPTVLSATVDNSCANTPATPSITVSCKDADYIELKDNTTGAVAGSVNGSQGTIPLTQAGTYLVICKQGGVNGTASTDNITRSYSPSTCLTSIQSFQANPRTLKSGGNTSLQWVIAQPNDTCAITAQAVCTQTCSALQLSRVDTINNELQNGVTDPNDPNGAGRSMTSALQTNVITDGSTAKAIGKKKIQVFGTTDFIVNCTSDTRKVRVQVSNDSEG